MAPLPAVRVHYSPPFSKVGVDYTADFPIKMSRYAKVPQKCYIVLFTCLITRAVHLELVLSNETENFLQALKRMMATRGTPVHMYSDNAQYFKKADKFLRETISENNKTLETAAKKFEFKWSYSTELHSSGGGVWERAIKSIKQPLRKLLNSGEVVSYVDFLTLVKTVEAQVNDRPLVSSSENTFDVITPSMLCLGRRIALWQDHFAETQLKSDSNERTRWEQRQNMDQTFKELWMKQYLPELQARHNWFTKAPNIRVGDLVLVEQAKKKQHQWPVAKVQKILYSEDGLIRTVIILPEGQTNSLRRSIHELFPLETCREKQILLPLDSDVSEHSANSSS